MMVVMVMMMMVMMMVVMVMMITMPRKDVDYKLPLPPMLQLPTFLLTPYSYRALPVSLFVAWSAACFVPLLPVFSLAPFSAVEH